MGTVTKHPQRQDGHFRMSAAAIREIRNLSESNAERKRMLHEAMQEIRRLEDRLRECEIDDEDGPYDPADVQEELGLKYPRAKKVEN